MIYIGQKGNVPNSLLSQNTLDKRQQIIDNQQYINESAYNNCYKEEDIRIVLAQHYNNKCAYCESKKGANSYYPIEHYRPKSIYHWLAFSWDNLLLSCTVCNTKKGFYFAIDEHKEQATFDSTHLDNIHTLCNLYSSLELPLLLNPEQDEASLKNIWAFEKDGQIDSLHPRGRYTIDTVKLNREDLQKVRQDIWVDFVEKIDTLQIEFYGETDLLLRNVRLEMERFIKETQEPETEFIAFRRYLISCFNELMSDLFAPL